MRRVCFERRRFNADTVAFPRLFEFICGNKFCVPAGIVIAGVGI